jgi:hypothetical protein
LAFYFIRVTGVNEVINNLKEVTKFIIPF